MGIVEDELRVALEYQLILNIVHPTLRGYEFILDAKHEVIHTSTEGLSIDLLI